ncbi:MAG: copper amine oxidase N-terminal domain-containing protein [Candidatus Cohnella colombiensis]|uniref:Copper amine oxidase N-terminal domain-containing protein n=1 Tax=Candidatus Cohnella colombiensis TaxID=3121368 RepID=A0AA95EX63_9BACL|nr:MAG: copper amine oxidase N-terminal domain-containing protein [Cohnella sp.]
MQLMKRMKRMVVLLLSTVLLVPTIVTASSTTPPTYHFEWQEGGGVNGEVIMKKGISYVDLENIAQLAGMSLNWDNKHLLLQLFGIDKTIEIRVGDSIAYLDGTKVNMGGVPFIQNKTLYVPARFVVTALQGAGLKWDKNKQILNAVQIHKYDRKTSTYGGLVYSVDYNSGNVYTTNGKGVKRQIATQGSPFFEYITYQFQKTAGGLLLVTISDNYGEPHVHNQVLYLLIKNGSVVRQSKVNYFKRYTTNVTFYDGFIALTDGKKLRIFEDGTANLVDSINLVKLGDKDDNYFIEGIDKEFILFRANADGILKLYNRYTKDVVVLSEELLSGKQLEYAQTNDLPYWGDGLVYLGREGDSLMFRNDMMIEKDTTIYKYTLPDLS